MDAVPESPPSLNRGEEMTHADVAQERGLEESLSLLVPRLDAESEKEPSMLTPCGEASRHELQGRIFQDTATGHVHVYVEQTHSEAKPPTVPGIPIAPPRHRWKPNQQQLTLLERHFDAGFSKSTLELHAAVQAAGEATDTQVAVWLKNRLARSKRIDAAKKASGTSLPLPSHGNSLPHCNTFSAKRLKHANENPPQIVDEIRKVTKTAMNEVSNALALVSSGDVRFLTSELIRRQKLCCYGVGRERCILQSLVIRLKQLGLDAHLIGETFSPVVGPRDLLLASAGPSFFNTVNAVCLAGIRAKAHVIVLTSHRTAPIPFADSVIRIPAPHAPSSAFSVVESNDSQYMNRFLPLGSAYESTLWMLFESICLLIQHELGVSENDMLIRSGNLE